MDPYTEYLATDLARREPSYRIPQPRATRPEAPRANRWRLRPVRR